MTRRIRICTAAASVISLMDATPTSSATIRVPSEAPTIAVGLQRAIPGDSVVVAPGTYYETGLIMPRGVAIMSEAGPTATIIDGSMAEYGETILFGDGIGPASRLAGFTLQSAWAGVRLSFSGPLISENVFRSLVVAIDSHDSSPHIVNNLFDQTDNAIIVDASAAIVIRQNTFVDTYSTAIVFDTYAPVAQVDHNIIIRAFVGVFCFASEDCPSPLAFQCNNVWDSTFADFYGFVYNPIGLDGNFSADPLFCGESIGVYTLDASSPCAPALSPAGCGLIGALPVGCGDPTTSTPVSWGAIKSLFRQ